MLDLWIDFVYFALVAFSIPLKLEWGGKVVTEAVEWFQNESDPSLNSNVYQEAEALVQKHFPGKLKKYQ